ncbi:peptidylprolyl isomerase [Paenibacillus piri]|uniref:peptidylprolyl isomerase n=1 Tax=Paenibacillus piri TaxID=2547395 RepID=UPI001404BB63|nr:peptidylprolyl isomerase [Paenibacillus piri]
MNTSLANRKWMFVSLILLIILIAYAVVYPPIAKSSEAVAKVNGTTISKDQLVKTALAGTGQQTVQRMIEQELIRQEADKAGIQIQDADIEKEIGKLKQNFPSDNEFNQALEANGLTLDGIKEEMKPQVMMNKLLEKEVTVTDDEIKQYYDKNLDSLKTQEQVKASHILVATKEEADAILADLKKGADFAKTAQEKSQDTGTNSKGGDLDFISRGVMESSFETAAFALKPGEISDVVQTSNGFHIIKVTDHKDAATPTLDEKKTEIHDILADEKVQTMSAAWLQQKKSEAKIEDYSASVLK